MSAVEISVIVPVHDEESNLVLLKERLDETLGGLDRSSEVIVVDDGSRDGSFELLRGLAEKDPALRVVRLPRNYGQTAAIACGLRHSRGRVVIPIDADLQNDPADIPHLVAKLDEGWDVVSGWRRERKDPYFRRVLPSRLANRLISRLTGVALHDHGCTLKAYRRAVMKSVSLYGEMHRLLPALARQHGARITELPVRHQPRLRGRSKYGLMRTFKVLLNLLTVKFLDTYLPNPIYLFGGFGLACCLSGAVSGVLLVYHKFAHRISFIQSPLLLLTALLATLGVLSILMGLLAEITVRTYFEAQDKVPYTVSETLNIEDTSAGSGD